MSPCLLIQSVLMLCHRLHDDLQEALHAKSEGFVVYLQEANAVVANVTLGIEDIQTIEDFLVAVSTVCHAFNFTFVLITVLICSVILGR